MAPTGSGSSATWRIPTANCSTALALSASRLSLDSDNPALRMLMVDGRMLVEGQAVSPGLRLERIGPHQAVFNHRGTRFSVDY